MKRGLDTPPTLDYKIRRVNLEMPVNGAQVTTSRIRSGKKPRKGLRRTIKIVRNLLENYVLKFSNIRSAFSNQGQRGALTLASREYNFASALIGADPKTANDRRYPVHLYDVTGCINETGINATKIDATVGMELCRVQDAAAHYTYFQYRPIFGQDSNPIAPTRLWTRYLTTDRNSDAYPGKASILDYMDLKLVFYGPQNAYCKFFVDLVQFQHDSPSPLRLTTTDQYGVDHPTDMIQGIFEHEDCMEALVKPLIVNPIVDTQPGALKGLKILKSWQFHTNPETTIDKATTGQQKIVKIFHRFNRQCNWNWHNEHDENFANIIATDADVSYKPDLNVNAAHVDPRARVYLMIRATNYTVWEKLTNSSTGEGFQYNVTADPAWDPTYDINIKVKHTFQN